MLGLTIVERIVEWIQPAFLVAGYAIVGVGVLLERSIFVGLLVPGDVILALGGVYAAQGELRLPLVILLGTAAAVCGESIGFFLGRHFGPALIRRLPFGRRLVRVLEDSQEFLQRFGGWTVAIGRYATAAGAFIPFTVGASGMSYPRFLLFDVPAIAVWAAGITVFGYYFGQNLAFVDTVLSRFGSIVLGLLAAFFLGRWVWKRRRARRGAPTPGDGPPIGGSG
jgi:membrane-associated protein